MWPNDELFGSSDSLNARFLEDDLKIVTFYSLLMVTNLLRPQYIYNSQILVAVSHSIGCLVNLVEPA